MYDDPCCDLQCATQRKDRIQHTPTDPGRTLGGGKTVASPKQFWGGWHIGYNRMNFREDLGWKDHSTFQISPGSHTDQIMTKYYKKEPIPFTINMGIPPAATMVAGAGFMYTILPRGCDELGIAGAIQGFPMEMVKCKTIDAYAIARATGMGSRINTIMQTCFFAISGVLPREQAIDEIKRAIERSYGKRGQAVVERLTGRRMGMYS